MSRKKRELDSITPDFTLSPEDIADLKRILTDKEYAEECRKEREAEEAKHLAYIKEIIVTGKDPDKGTILPRNIIEDLKKHYKGATGVDLDKNDK